MTAEPFSVSFSPALGGISSIRMLALSNSINGGNDV